MRFLENFRNRPSNFSCVLGTLKGVQNAPEHHHNISISISNLQKRVLGPFCSPRPPWAWEFPCTALHRPTEVCPEPSRPMWTGLCSGSPGGGQQVPWRHAPSRPRLEPKRTLHARRALRARWSAQGDMLNPPPIFRVDIHIEAQETKGASKFLKN